MRSFLAVLALLAATALTASEPVFLQTDPKVATARQGSYQLARDRVLDIGVMDELGGDLVFLDQKTRRIGRLRAISANEMVAGPTVAVDTPFDIRAEFVHDRAGNVTGLRWTGEGVRRKFAKKIAPRVDHQVEIQRGDVTLRGVLHVPAGKGPHPAILFAHGSGDTTRNVGYWNSYFVRLGFAVLSLDKRGAGVSTGDWSKATLDDIADDWLAGVEYLKKRPDIDPKRIGVHGSSQGGWTAPLMAAKSKDVAFVIVRAGSGNNLIDTMVHEIEWTVREAGHNEAEVAAARAAAAEAFALAARGASWSEFEAATKPHLAQKWGEAVWAIRMSENGWGRPWVQMNAHYDSAVALRNVRVPVLWFLADNDHNVPSEASRPRIAAALREAGNDNVTIVTLRNASHGFMETPTGNNSEFATLKRMPPGYWDGMETWLRANGFIAKR